MMRRPPRSTPLYSSAASDVYKRQVMRQNAQGIIELQGDSDAAIVKGLIAVVFILYDQMTPQDIVNFDVRPWFEKMALTQHLTPSRSQGLEAMIRAIRAKAAALS